MNEEDYDLYYHALNYRTAASQHAEAAWKELEACHGRLLAREKESTEYGWKNVRILEKAYQDERAKREAMSKNAESMALQASYNALMNENSALHKITTDLCYDVLAACSFRDDNSPAGLSLTVLYKSPALDKARELVADAEDKEVEAMLK